MNSTNKSWFKNMDFSFQTSKKFLFVFSFLILLNLLVLVVSIGVGEYQISYLDVIKTILNVGSTDYDFIVNTLRLPRTLIAFLAGLGLAMSGSILQSVTRNSLASPSVIGLNAGASLAAVTLIVLFPTLSIFFLPFIAFLGALITGGFVYFLALKQGSSPVRLILVGVGISSIAQALITILMTFGHINLVGQATIWMTGSVYGKSWEYFWPVLPWMIVLIPVTLLQTRHLNILRLSDEFASGVGIRVELHRWLLIITAIALAGASVAAAGTINFVGLMAPHMARRLVGASFAPLVLVAALIGGLLVMLADLLGRIILSPIEIPCGIITAIIGTPYLIYLLLREKDN